MFVIGLIKSVVPFFMTLSLSVFIASFFVVLPTPKVEVSVERSWNSHSSRSYCREKRKMRRIERKVRRLKMMARRMKKETHRLKMKEHGRVGVRVIEMVEVPPRPPAPVNPKK